MRIGYLILGAPRHGVHRYAETLSDEASRRPGVEVTKVYLELADNRSANHREIGRVTVGPQLARLPKENHMDSSRRLSPDSRELAGPRKRAYRERMRAARQSPAR